MYRLMRLLLAFSLLLGFGVLLPADASHATELARFETALADVRAMVEAVPDKWGLAVAVTDRERVRLVATHGDADIDRHIPVTADTRFAIGSISKSFVAITLMQMADEGRFDPAAPIVRYLPDFHPRSAFSPITGHALLSHTSGLPNYQPQLASMRFLPSALDDWEPRYPPGAHFWYSNAGYQLLGYATEQIEGRPYPLVLKQRVLDRLGMTDTDPQIDDRLLGRIAKSYVRAPDGSRRDAPWFPYLAADGAIVSTVGDMSRYARMLLGHGQTPSGRLISAKAFDRFATPVLDDYGYGIDVLEGGKVLAHSGSIAGFEAYLNVDLGNGVAVVFLGNGPIDRTLRDRVIARLSEGMGGRPKATPAIAPRSFAPPASFAGRFVGAKGETLVFAPDPAGGLVLREGNGMLPLTRLGRDVWGAYLAPGGPRTFLFFRDGTGVATDVSEGVSSYTRQGGSPVLKPAQAGWRSLVGRYMAHGEEGPGVRIFARNGQLMMAYADSNAPPTPLVEDGPGRFRFAEPVFAPEWLGFDTIIAGQAQRLILSGIPLYRIELP
ncbi:Beta-lactamase [hydrothermal vent metagenome]|jgi:CubicO group peptidase (beta-lactamase class C family)|uniref:Beta-lactamase n=2 Tax=root TaxID=1 RepID=A0A160TKA2_9ZZZZ